MLSDFQVLFIGTVREDRMAGGGGSSRHWVAVLSTAAHVARGENALQRPEHDDTEQHY